jgi:hypothetical protein
MATYQITLHKGNTKEQKHYMTTDQAIAGYRRMYKQLIQDPVSQLDDALAIRISHGGIFRCLDDFEIIPFRESVKSI